MVNGYLLTLLEERPFSVAGFFETRQRVCRLMPPLPQSMAGVAPRLAKPVAPVVEQVAQRLVQGQNTTAKPIRVLTLLSQANRSRGRDEVWRTANTVLKSGRLTVPTGCRDCGVVLEDTSRMYCDNCLSTYREEQTTAFSEAGPAKLAELRSAGKDPSKGGRAKAKRGQKNRQHMLEQEAWEAEHGTGADPEVFRREILPQLQEVSLGVMAEAT